MTLLWQNLVVGTVIAWAAWFIGRKVVRMFRGRKSGGGCGTCSSCPASGSEPSNLVTLDTPPTSRDVG